MRALVTGGAGFIGSQLAGELCARGHEVRVLDNFSTGHRANLAALPADPELVEGDIQSYERVHNAVQGCEVVFHQAALPSVPRSVQDPLTSNAANVIGTLNVLLAARDSGVRRVVYASSSSVYGATETLPKREDLPAVPISPYAVAKLAGEGYCRSFSQVYGLETVALRYFNVFGPRQDPLSQYAAVIPNFITACLDGRPPKVYGDGEQSRDFTFVGDVVRANLLAGEAEGVSGQAFNIAAGNRITINDLVEEVRCGHRLRGRGGARAGASRRRQAFARRPLAGPGGPRLRAADRPQRGPAAHRRRPAGSRGARRSRVRGASVGRVVAPTRVLRVIARMNVGGPAYHVSLLSGRLDRDRYATLLAHGHTGPGEESFAELARQEGCRVEVVEGLGPQVSPLADLRALFGLIRLIRRYRPEIVHTHTAKAGALGRLAARLAIRPRPIVVHTYHGHVLEGYFGPLLSGAYRLLERFLARSSDRLIAVSQATVDDLVRLGVAPRDAFQVVPLGLDLGPVRRSGSRGGRGLPPPTRRAARRAAGDLRRPPGGDQTGRRAAACVRRSG